MLTKKPNQMRVDDVFYRNSGADFKTALHVESNKFIVCSFAVLNCANFFKFSETLSKCTGNLGWLKTVNAWELVRRIVPHFCSVFPARL